MANVAIPSDKVPCSYKNCDQVFDSEKEMRRHKVQDERHDYCGRCNVDCDGAVELFIHQITSSQHIICPVCSVEFRSTGGRDVHIQLNHRRDQNLTCTGCGRKYKSASALIWHIENHECDGISCTRLTQEQARRSMINASLHATRLNSIPEPPGTPNAQHSTRASDQDDSQDGGVRLDMNIGATQCSYATAASPNPTIKTSAEYLSPEEWHVLVPKVASPQTLVIREKSTVIVPATPSSASSTTPTSLPIGPDDLISFDEVPETTQDGKSTSRPGTFNRRLVRDNTFGIGPVKPGTLILQTNAQWDPKKFFNASIGRYVCNCGGSFRSVDDFEMHIVTEREIEERDECPKCHKRFKSTSALVAHMEASRSRCGIGAYREFAHALDEVTGGIIQVKGYDESGNQLLAARVLDDSETVATTTIGADLSKPMKQLM